MTVRLRAEAMDAGTATGVAVPAPDRIRIADRAKAAWRAFRQAVGSWVAEQRRTIGSTGIKLAIASSVAMFAGFAATQRQLVRVCELSLWWKPGLVGSFL